MQHLVVANRKTNASRGKPQENVMTPQHKSDLMALFLSSGSRRGFRPGHGMHAVL
jgi:hypothetical protein